MAPKQAKSHDYNSKYQEIMEALLLPVSSYTMLYEPHLIPKIRGKKRIKPSILKGLKPSAFQATNKDKHEEKGTKEKGANTFPTNVKSLAETGILDGVHVQYINKTKKKELQGIIKGSSYYCGCDSCDYIKTVNAYEFEDHAGCKTSHPNNHIHFENGKSIHMVVQELKNTPKSMLFDAIQIVTGSKINQEAFSIWKESYQAE